MDLECREILTGAGLSAFVDEIGFLPLLSWGVRGWSAEDQVAEECNYTALPEGGWEWPLWEWKGSVIQEGGCAYGKFFFGKAGFVSRELWPDFCSWRRSRYPQMEEDSIEAMILATLRESGSLVTRDLRKACGFGGKNMRGKFDSYITRLEKGCHIVTEDFVYPHDSHGKPYGWGWSLLTTPEALFGARACHPDRTPEESHARLVDHFRKLLPEVPENVIKSLIG